MSETEEKLLQMQQLLQKSLIKIRTLESELEQQKNQTNTIQQDIAIVSTACRFPAGITSTKALWQIIKEEKNIFSKIPNNRFNVDAIYSTDELEKGKTNAQYGAFLTHQPSDFDADFFGIPPREAKSIDPLQRIMLEVVYEAFENAGLATQQLKESNTGVFVAIGNSDYIQARLRNGNLESVDVYDATGIPFATACGRISYLYNFRGTSLSVDTACSSVLTAIQLAKNALQNKEIDTAVIASANLILTPELFVGLSKLGSLSTTNELKAFDQNADGYIRGEGIGVLILKRVDDAVQQNLPIELVIKAIAIKHNGTSNGFTAPNPEVQIQLINETLQQANINANQVDLVEAHGIGNVFTDAMEIQSIATAYQNRINPIYINSVKSNIGHLEACTGMSMIFKVIESFKNETIPAQISITNLNEDVNWNAIKAVVPTTPIEWKKSDKKRYAAINLSGYSGTNAHIIFEEAPNKIISENIDSTFIFNFSAKTKQALLDYLQKYLTTNDWKNDSLTEIAYTLNKKNLFDYRCSIVADSHQVLEEKINQVVNNEKSDVFITNELNEYNDIAFLCTGQGAQYFGMCKQLYDHYEVFKMVIDDCDKQLQPMLQESIMDVLWKDESKAHLIHQTKFTQPCLFVVEYAIAQLYMSFGIEPNYLVGHSIGELSCLAIANAIDLEAALQLVVARAALMQSLPINEGVMASVFCSEAIIKPFLENSSVDLAAINAPKNVTIAGLQADVEKVLATLKENKIKAVMLQVSHAFHSSQMDAILPKFEQFVAQFSFKEPQIPVISNATGLPLSLSDLTPNYFAKHIRNTIQFEKSIQYLSDKVGVFVECGPHPVLINLAKHCNSNKAVYIATTTKDKDALATFNNALQELYINTINVKFENLFVGKKINTVPLPTYAWQWKSYWYNPVLQDFLLEENKEKISITNQKVNNKKDIVKTNLKLTKENLLVTMQIEAAKILELEAGQKININESFRNQGFDSMMSGEFLSIMERMLGEEQQMSVIHDYPTPKTLAQYWTDKYFGGGEVDEHQAISMADVMFDAAMDEQIDEQWHEIKPTDNWLMRAFKKFDSKLPKV
ncbi:MAG: type I polyketide synthase [Chitinophagales bacterium]|nr:type I polyketide synthase [Chitinophagales bacterium]